jgi:glycosyltransferase involved in cell wall biosynthesis
MDKIQISIIIPCHNNKENLKWILKSVNCCGADNFEIICIDDASTENIKETAQYFGARYFRLPGSTPGRRALARNIGHKLSNGKISFYIDGDVIPEPRLIRYSFKLHNEQRKAVVKYPVYSLPERHHKIRLEEIANAIVNHNIREFGPYVTKHCGIDTRPLPKRLRGKKTKIWVLCASHCTSFEKVEVDKVGGWDDSFNGWGEEDLELAYRLYQSNNYFIYPHRKFGAGYHLDHPSNWDEKLPSLKQNISYFRSKYPESWEGRKGLLRMFLSENNLHDISTVIS